MKTSRSLRASAAVLALFAAAAVARAEIVEITGEFPAEYREASFLRSLHIERFGGPDGPALQMAIERALANSAPFDLVAGRAGRAGADGSMSGAVSTGVEESGFRRKDKKCVERDAKDKCIKEEQIEIPCRRRVININADLRIVRNTDGRIVYSRPHAFRDETSWCQGQSPYRTVEDTVSTAIQEIAGRVRLEVAPHVETYRIRLRESTKGMAKDMAKAFKALIKSSQRNLAGACAAWEVMDRGLPGNPSLLFNLGLCAEQRGDYEGAVALFRQAVAAGAREGAEGADRAQRLIAGRDDAREREKRR